jgi:biopolymer transport protein ExbB
MLPAARGAAAQESFIELHKVIFLPIYSKNRSTHIKRVNVRFLKPKPNKNMKIHRHYVLMLVFLTLCLCGSTHATETAPGIAASSHSGEDKTLWGMVKQGGFMMIPLGLTSVIMFALIGDSIARLRNSQLAPPDLIHQLQAQFQAGDYKTAYQTCKSRPSFVSNVAMAGLEALAQGKAATERAMEDALAREVIIRTTRIRYLSVIGVVTPMMGLTGTVLGMIKAFSTLGGSGLTDPSGLAGAIGEVLVATLTGLAVAIPAFFSYYIFGNRITATSAYAEDVINSLFRGMPYEQFVGIQIGDETIYAAPPHPSLAATRMPETEAAGARTVACPCCQQALLEGVPACPSCQTALQWAA